MNQIKYIFLWLLLLSCAVPMMAQSDVEITDEIKSLVEKELYKVEFTERTFEPDYDDYYE